MRLRPDSRRAPRAAGGFTLLEAVIAAGLVLLTITAVTSCVVSVSRAGARLEGHMDADRAAWRVAERLRVLPFCAGSYPQATAHDRRSCVRPGRGRLSARGRRAEHRLGALRRLLAGAGGEEAGSFVTLFSEDGVEVTCVARFLAGPDGTELGPDGPGGWDARSASAPPSGTLSVTLSVPGGGQRTSFVRSALSRPPISADDRGGSLMRRATIPRRADVRRDDGFTLVELLIAAGIAAVVLTAAYAWLWNVAALAGGADDRAQAATLADAVSARSPRTFAPASASSSLRPGAILRDRSSVVHDHAAAAAETVLIVWDPAQRRRVAQRVRHVPVGSRHALRRCRTSSPTVRSSDGERMASV